MRYKHDCDKCKPLGMFLDRDLYFCNAIHDTVIARYGDEPDEYISGLALYRDPYISIAISRAKYRGYISDK